MRARLEELDTKPSVLKDLLGRVTGDAFVLFARARSRTRPGKLVAHAFSYEHMEEAAYELLIRSRSAPETRPPSRSRAGSARRSSAWASGWPANFDVAVDASLRALEPGDLGEQVNKYLADAHALEAQAIELLSKGEQIGGDPQLKDGLREHLEESREHQRLVEARLTRAAAKPSGAEGCRPAPGRAELGDVLPVTTRHPGQAGRIRVRVRASRDRGLRAAEARRAARRRHRDRRSRGTHFGEQERAQAKPGSPTGSTRRSTARYETSVSPWAPARRKRRRIPPRPRPGTSPAGRRTATRARSGASSRSRRAGPAPPA